MLTDRIMGAFTMHRGVYADVEKDTSFTTTAWILVAVVAFLSQLGSFASRNVVSWLAGAIGGTILAILGFAVGVLVINWVGRLVFKADVRFNELVRTLGLAYVWQVVGILGIPAAFSVSLPGELYMVRIFALTMLVLSWLVAAREALDLTWLQTIVPVILGGLAQFVIAAFGAGLMVGLLG